MECLLECGEFVCYLWEGLMFASSDLQLPHKSNNRGALGGTDANGTNIFFNLEMLIMETPMTLPTLE